METLCQGYSYENIVDEKANQLRLSYTLQQLVVIHLFLFGKYAKYIELSSPTPIFVPNIRGPHFKLISAHILKGHRACSVYSVALMG